MTDTVQITHPELVTALLKPGAEIIDSLTPDKADLLHAAIGISGEAGEILEAAVSVHPSRPNRTNMIEELGDIEFYLQGYRASLGVVRRAPDFILKPSLDSHIERASGLAIAASQLLDLTKKVVVYNKPRTAELLVQIENSLITIEFWLERIRIPLSISRDDTIAANIVKLATGPNARYKLGKYSDQAAQDRADKAVN